MVCRLVSLPPDVLAQLLRFLSGFDLLPLSHVDRRFHTELLAPNGVVWRSRLPSRAFVGETVTPTKRSTTKKWKATYKWVLGNVKDLVRTASIDRDPCGDTVSWKRLYFTSSSLRLPGCQGGVVVERQVGGALPLWDGLAHAWNADSFSFDVWFALQPATKTKLTGGILFAAQGTEWPGVKFGDDMQQFLHVDTSGDLYCSMLVEKAIVVRRLQTWRWYHVAVSVQRTSDDWWKARQCVYLDGELVHASKGSVHPRWRYLNHAQLGSGVIEGDAPGSPSPQHRGWYGFNGVVDEFRLWGDAITSDHARQLFCGEENLVETDLISCRWSMKRDGFGAQYGTNVRMIRCTRPKEERCTHLRVSSQHI